MNMRPLYQMQFSQTGAVARPTATAAPALGHLPIRDLSLFGAALFLCAYSAEVVA
jgi:hypothetical protein